MLKIIDFIIIIAMVWFAFKGIKKGLMYEVLSILALIIGAWGAFTFSNIIEGFIGKQSEIMHLVAWAVTFILIVAGIFIIGTMLKACMSIIIPDIIDKIAGLLFGAFKVMFFFGIIFYYINSVDVYEKLISSQAKEDIIMYKPTYNIAVWVLPKVKEAKGFITDKHIDSSSDSLQNLQP
ncbi:MAG: CvpA family protein [Bacteroidales bacterium]|jgi:membrane protein required for colicin V production|nr:CvpA family protein [Bacteroidales bacterium]MDD2687738.1 CvpA family protein [Bacteroidales bacterium]MDD4581493.1 CvpA family protein [Bacteroidales bacterium]NLO43267.1 CvpA family protein [Bacteroidales bacterium]